MRYVLNDEVIVVDDAPRDVRVVACNFVQGTITCSEASLAYVLLTNPGWGSARLCILARSRSGRWIARWEDIRRLTNFRMKTLPPEHPRHRRFGGFDGPGDPEALQARADELRAAGGLAPLIVQSPARKREQP